MTKAGVVAISILTLLAPTQGRCQGAFEGRLGFEDPIALAKTSSDPRQLERAAFDVRNDSRWVQRLLNIVDLIDERVAVRVVDAVGAAGGDAASALLVDRVESGATPWLTARLLNRLPARLCDDSELLEELATWTCQEDDSTFFRAAVEFLGRSGRPGVRGLVVLFWWAREYDAVGGGHRSARVHRALVNAAGRDCGRSPEAWARSLSPPAVRTAVAPRPVDTRLPLMGAWLGLALGLLAGVGSWCFKSAWPPLVVGALLPLAIGLAVAGGEDEASARAAKTRALSSLERQELAQDLWDHIQRAHEAKAGGPPPRAHVDATPGVRSGAALARVVALFPHAQDFRLVPSARSGCLQIVVALSHGRALNGQLELKGDPPRIVDVQIAPKIARLREPLSADWEEGEPEPVPRQALESERLERGAGTRAIRQGLAAVGALLWLFSLMAPAVRPRAESLRSRQQREIARSDDAAVQRWRRGELTDYRVGEQGPTRAFAALLEAARVETVTPGPRVPTPEPQALLAPVQEAEEGCVTAPDALDTLE